MSRKRSRIATPTEEKEPPLQPLRIPGGWDVEWNSFYALEPSFQIEDDISWLFHGGMLFLANRHRGVAVTLGWLPAHRPSGAFIVTAIRLREDSDYGEPSDWNDPLKVVRTRSTSKAVKTLEEWLDWYTNNEVQRKRRKMR